MNIINLTPHAITYINNGTSEVFEPSGEIARVEQFLFSIPGCEKYNLKTTVPSCVVGLPKQDVNTVYIVSAMVREAEKERDDLWSPTSFIRDENGNIVGCEAFIVN